MYKVYVDDILIHDSRTPETAIHLVSPVLKMSDNAAGSFDMTTPPMNPGYDVIQRHSSTIFVKKDNTTIWSGRVITESEDFWKRRKFTCEGALSYLNDTIQELAYYDNYTLTQFFTAIINVHNSKAPANRQFRIGTISMTDAKENFEYKTEYKNTWNTISEVFLDRLGGHIRVRYGNDNVPIIDYLKDYPNMSAQTIDFGSNLLDFTRNWDLSNLITVILPRGKQSEEENAHGDREYLSIASVNSGSKYLQNTQAVQTYGRIEAVVDFNDAEDATTLKRLAELYLSTLQFDMMTLSVSAVDLHMLNPSIVSFELLDEVRCYSAPHGLNKVFPITTVDIPLDSPESVTYTMGSSEQVSMSSSAAQSTRSIQNNLRDINTNLLADAKHQATELINQKTTGYVNIVTENETSQALIISNTPDLETATKLWRWNLNGLGYMDKSKSDDYQLAITQNGVIVADFIKTGMLEDGFGLNHWNLTTGEFTLAYNTEFANLAGDTITIVDVNTLAQTGVDDAATAQNTADTAMHKQSGVTNILRGTNKNLKLASGSGSKWSEGTWDGNSGAAAREKKVINISGSPNPSIVKGFSISPNNTTNFTGVIQRQVEVVGGQVYTISCYAYGTASKIRLGVYYSDSSSEWQESDLTNKWRRYSATFKVHNNATKIGVAFSTVGDQSKTMYVCGMKLERGNTASDWSESEWDTYGRSTTTSKEYTDVKAESLQTYTKKYTDTISKNDREFTEAQRKALDESFTQYKVLQRLTNNFAAKGIYLTNNQLYINASYIRTGTLDAGIVKTGILTDHAGKNKWNMATGYLYTRNMEAVNMAATGQFEAGSTYKMVLGNDGALHGYQDSGRTWVGSVDPSANFTDVDTGRKYKGIQLRGSGCISFRSPEIAVRDKNDHGIASICYTGKFSRQYISKIETHSDGTFTYWTNTLTIHIVNGFITSIY